MIEHVTVISGTLHMGTGGKLDRSKTTPLPAGSVDVNPADDPRKPKQLVTQRLVRP